MASREELLVALRQVVEPRSYNCNELQSCLELHESVLQQIHQLNASSTVADFDKLIVTFITSYCRGLNALPDCAQIDLLEDVMVRTGALGPFVGLSPKGDYLIGLPTNSEVVCDTLSELCRAVAASLVCVYRYLNFAQAAEDFPSEDSALLFINIVLRTLKTDVIVQKLNEQLEEMQAEVTCDHVRWLMHFVRANLLGALAQVFLAVNDTEKFREYLVAQQQDYLCCIKVLPNSPLGYVHYSKLCLQFQQTKAAYLFASKGLTVANKVNSDLYAAKLCYLTIVAAGLGGKGEYFTRKEVQDLNAQAVEQIEKLKSWMPEWHDLTEFLAPDDNISKEKVLPLCLESAPESIAALELVYTTRPLQMLPPGALVAGVGEQ